jgi:hypothetical protein
MRTILMFLATALFALTAAAADISGTWKGTAQTPNGPVERTFVFKQDGTKLTGETKSDMFGNSVIKDGKVEGDEVTFHIDINYEGNDATLSYKGKVTSDGFGSQSNFRAATEPSSTPPGRPHNRTRAWRAWATVNYAGGKALR